MSDIYFNGDDDIDMGIGMPLPGDPVEVLTPEQRKEKERKWKTLQKRGRVFREREAYTAGLVDVATRIYVGQAVTVEQAVKDAHRLIQLSKGIAEELLPMPAELKAVK